MAQSSVLPSMRGILSGGNWKILKVTSGRYSPECAGRNSKPRKAQRNNRLDINLLHFNRTVSPASHAPTVATAAVTRVASVNAAATLPRNENMHATRSAARNGWVALELPSRAIRRLHKPVGLRLVGDAHGSAVPLEHLFGAQREGAKQGHFGELAGEFDGQRRGDSFLAGAGTVGVMVRLLAARQRFRGLLEILELACGQQQSAGQGARRAGAGGAAKRSERVAAIVTAHQLPVVADKEHTLIRHGDGAVEFRGPARLDAAVVEMHIERGHGVPRRIFPDHHVGRSFGLGGGRLHGDVVPSRRAIAVDYGRRLEV